VTKDTTPGAPKRNINMRDRDKVQDDQLFKKIHTQLVGGPLSGTSYVEWQHLDEVVGDSGPVRRRGEQVDTNQSASSWNPVPGDVDGIYANIILPEMRAVHDVRAIEYWDAKLRREADVATRTKLQFEIDRFNTERRPELLWSRAQEFEWIGMKNRAALEMFGVLKNSPASPHTAEWVKELQDLISPKPAATAAAPAASAGVAPPPLPGAK
jgi:hypothetical protein